MTTNTVAPQNMGKRLRWDENDGTYNVDIEDILQRIVALEKKGVTVVEKITTIEKTTSVFNVDLLIGMPFPYPKEEVPTGYIALKGQTITQDEYPKLFAMYGEVLPDMRGEFIRGWDNGRGIDPGRIIRSTQKGSAIAYDPTEDSKNIVSIINNSDTVLDTLDKQYEHAGYDLPANIGDRYEYLRVAAINQAYAHIDLYEDGEHAFRIGVARPKNTAYQYICLAG